jgi:hypothetical protein
MLISLFLATCSYHLLVDGKLNSAVLPPARYCYCFAAVFFFTFFFCMAKVVAQVFLFLFLSFDPYGCMYPRPLMMIRRDDVG